MNSLFPSLFARFVPPFANIPIDFSASSYTKTGQKNARFGYAGKIAALDLGAMLLLLSTFSGLKPRPLAPGPNPS
jgi:hypothetical protein